jgi:hypothetical protein
LAYCCLNEAEEIWIFLRIRFLRIQCVKQAVKRPGGGHPYTSYAGIGLVGSDWPYA